MKFRCAFPGISLTMLFLQSAMAQPLPVDAPVTRSGIEAACTGVSLDARGDPRWQSYSLKVEFAGPGGGYLGGEEVTLLRDGKPLLTASCIGPWLLFRLPQGRYQVRARIGDQTVNSPALVPASGQGRLVLRFAKAEE